ncbi:MAG: hypothetical protein Q8909_04445 [Bacteroidota bacterium]|nr:hypothetical protein [Bacteroidota bacterium]
MKNRYFFIMMFIMLISTSLFSQDASIVGTWKFEEDSNSEIVFLPNNMCYRYYSGVLNETDSWTISNTSPQCGETVPVDETTSYLQLKDIKFNDEDCWLINGIRDEFMSISPVGRGGVFVLNRVITSGTLTMLPGFNYLTNCIKNYGGYAMFYFVFYPTSYMSVGTSYRVATISENCRPTVAREMSFTTGGRVWSVTVNPNGDVYAKIVSGSAVYGSSYPTNNVVSLGTLMYNY